MKKVLFLVAIVLFFGCKKSNYENDSAAIRFFPALNDVPLSNQFDVKVNGQKVVVEKIEKFDIPVHYAHFACDNSGIINFVISANEEIKSFIISPASKQIRGSIQNGNLVFSINEPEYLAIKINSMEYLFLMADSLKDYKKIFNSKPFVNIADFEVDKTGKTVETVKIQAAIDNTSTLGGVLYFPNGIYKTGQINFKNNMCVLLDDGALIKGTTNPADYPDKALIRMDSVSNFQLLGYGTIDGAGWEGLRKNGATGYHLLYISNCEKIEIDGVLLRDPTFWNTRVFRSKNVHLKNVKILNNRPYKNWTNTDGVDFDSSADCSVVHSIMHCGDDNLVVKGLDDQRKFDTERILFDDILVISNSAAAKIGTETCVKEFRDIAFKNIDVVKCKRGMVINGFDSAVIKNVVFENINIENFDFNGAEGPRIIDFEITDKSWRECVGLCKIDSVLVKGINVFCPIGLITSQILGKSADFSINNITIQDFKLNGKSANSLDEANIVLNKFVYSVNLK
jgi:hypothetical protein